MNVFISYPDSDGLDKAEITYNALKKYKYNPWYFDKNKTLGHLYVEELSFRIREWCDVFLFLCTKTSRGCDGQRWEIAQWFNEWTRIATLAVSIDNALIPQTIDVFSYERSLTSSHFEKEFEVIAKNFRNILARYKRLDKDLKDLIR